MSLKLRFNWTNFYVKFPWTRNSRICTNIQLNSPTSPPKDRLVKCRTAFYHVWVIYGATWFLEWPTQPASLLAFDRQLDTLNSCARHNSEKKRQCTKNVSRKTKGHAPIMSSSLCCHFLTSPFLLLNFRESAQETASRRSEHMTRVVIQCRPHPRPVPPPSARPPWVCSTAASASRRVRVCRRNRSPSTKTPSTWPRCRDKRTGARGPCPLIRWVSLCVVGGKLAKNYIVLGVCYREFN